jgi:hypothetical protein
MESYGWRFDIGDRNGGMLTAFDPAWGLHAALLALSCNIFPPTTIDVIVGRPLNRMSRRIVTEPFWTVRNYAYE